MEEFVIGMPLNMNGTKGMRAEQTENLQKLLLQHFRIFLIISGMKD